MRHFTSASFWSDYEKRPRNIRELADKSFVLLKENPQHPALHFKKVGKYWSARVGVHYRALAIEAPDGLLWIALVHHKRYDQIV